MREREKYKTHWLDKRFKAITVTVSYRNPCPSEIINLLLTGTGLEKEMCNFAVGHGFWVWLCDEIDDDVWDNALPLIRRNIEKLRDDDFVSAGSTQGYCTYALTFK